MNDADGLPATAGIALWAMIETPRAVLNAETIANRVACLVLGRQ